MFLPAELKRRVKALQSDVCCKAIEQNFDCGHGMGYCQTCTLAVPHSIPQFCSKNRHMEKQETEMKRKLEMETGNGNQKLKVGLGMRLQE